MQHLNKSPSLNTDIFISDSEFRKSLHKTKERNNNINVLKRDLIEQIHGIGVMFIIHCNGRYVTQIKMFVAC